MEYVKAHGIVAESVYSYTGSEGYCWINYGAYQLANVKTIQNAGDCGALRTAVRNAPVVVSISSTGWSGYSSGVFSCDGSPTVNHAAVLVGYTPELNWIIKNSWGRSWG